MSEQPAPIPNEREPVVEQVIRDLRARAEQGAAKYGTLLQPFNGRDQLRDAYEETLDLAQYLVALRVEVQELKAQASAMRQWIERRADPEQEGLPDAGRELLQELERMREWQQKAREAMRKSLEWPMSDEGLSALLASPAGGTEKPEIERKSSRDCPRYIAWVSARQFYCCERLVDALDWRIKVGAFVYEPLGASAAEKVCSEPAGGTAEGSKP